MPSPKVRASSSVGVMLPVNASQAIAPVDSPLSTAPVIIRLRRSKASASAPAGIVSISRGRVSAVVTRLTSNGDPVSSFISHGAAVSWRNVPRLLTTAVDHSLR